MKISVIIPVFNAGKFIAQCIDSVLMQEPAAHEIICIDDCSNDNSVALISKFTEQYPGRVRLIQLEKNSGAPFARNTGLKSAEGEYIQFLDADDYLLPGKFKHQLKILEDNNFPDFIAAAYTRRALNGNERNIAVNDGNAWLSLLKGELGCTCSNLWKLSSVVKAGGFRLNYASSQEYGLMFDLLKNSAIIIFDHDSFTMVRDQEIGQSVSKKNPTKNWEQFVKVRVETMEYLQSNKLIKEQDRNVFYQPLFGAIRILYNFSKQNAVDYFKKYIPADFVPIVGPGISSAYCKIYALFGFVMTEQFRSMFRIFKGRIKG